MKLLLSPCFAAAKFCDVSKPAHFCPGLFTPNISFSVLLSSSLYYVFAKRVTHVAQCLACPQDSLLFARLLCEFQINIPWIQNRELFQKPHNRRKIFKKNLFITLTVTRIGGKEKKKKRKEEGVCPAEFAQLKLFPE